MNRLTRLYCILLLSCLCATLCSAQRQRVTLRIAGDEWFLRSLTETGLIPTFEDKSGLKVEVAFKNDRAIMTDLDRSDAAGGAGADIIVVRHRFLGALVEKHEVRPIEPFLTDQSINNEDFHPRRQLFESWWKELSFYKNRFYGFPFTALTTYLCYRKDLLDDAANRREFQARYHHELRVPDNWQEYLQVAQFFSRGRNGFYGTYTQGKKSLALWYEWLNFIYSFGGNILDEQHGWQYGDIVINSPENVAATEQYLKLIQFSPPDTLSYGWNEAQSALQQGKVFMGLLWSDQAPFLEDPKKSKVAGKIGYARIPSATGTPFSQLEGLTYLITAKSQYAREAYKFLEWAMSEQLQVAQTLKGSSSVRKSAYDDSRIAALPYSSIFLASVPYGKPKPTVPESDQMTQAAVERLSEIVAGRLSVRRGLDMLAIDFSHILGEKGRLRYPVK